MHPRAYQTISTSASAPRYAYPRVFRATGPIKSMRHTILSLMIAISAAIGSFVLLAVLGVAVLRDSIGWILIFVGPAVFGILLIVGSFVGFYAFATSMVKLPDRGWRSTQALVIVLTFLATMAVVALIISRFLTVREHRAAGPEQGRLPVLHLAQTSEVLVGRPGCRQCERSVRPVDVRLGSNAALRQQQSLVRSSPHSGLPVKAPV
jgi:hypothetical protein